VRTLGLTAFFALLLLAAAAPAVAQSDEHPAPALLPAPDDALTDALEAGELTEAEYALERARSAFQLGRVRREFGDVERPGGHDATLLLRDLAVRQDELARADRVAAKRLLARPNGGGVPYGNGWTSPEAANSPACSLQPDVDLCVHWVDADGDPDAPEAVDDDPFNGVPDYVDLALVTLEAVWAHEIGALGYRPPLDDAGSPNDGGSGFDVYLDDLGGDGLFGYCTSDDPKSRIRYTVSAYCVLDDDYSPLQYGKAHSPREFLEVTAAHEFHHASQFAYDWGEDAWLMEGTATNMEEEVFPDVNDNVSFLEQWSPLTRPASPLDRSGSGGSAYGSWIFWRFLQEKVGRGPRIVREIWERADAALADDYSLQAVQKEVAQRGLPFVDAFVRFGVANRLLNYADAKSAGYPATPSTGSWYLGPSRPATSWQSWRIDHLATRFFSFAPGVGVARDARLRLRLTLPRTGARAAVIVVNADGSRTTRYVTPNQRGDAVRLAGFGRGAVARVHLVLSNGSTSTDCWTRVSASTTYSCLGTPRGDDRRFGFKAELVP
jgi:hypothetical protein